MSIEELNKGSLSFKENKVSNKDDIMNFTTKHKKSSVSKKNYQIIENIPKIPDESENISITTPGNFIPPSKIMRKRKISASIKEPKVNNLRHSAVVGTKCKFPKRTKYLKYINKLKTCRPKICLSHSNKGEVGYDKISHNHPKTTKPSKGIQKSWNVKIKKTYKNSDKGYKGASKTQNRNF